MFGWTIDTEKVWSQAKKSLPKGLPKKKTNEKLKN